MFCDGELNVLGKTLPPLYYFSLYFFLLIVFLACRTAAMKQLNESLLLRALQGPVKILNNKGVDVLQPRRISPRLRGSPQVVPAGRWCWAFPYQKTT